MYLLANWSKCAVSTRIIVTPIHYLSVNVSPCTDVIAFGLRCESKTPDLTDTCFLGFP